MLLGSPGAHRFEFPGHSVTYTTPHVHQTRAFTAANVLRGRTVQKMAGTFTSLNGDVDFPTFASPLRGLANNHISSPQPPNGSSASDARASLTRRFTTNTVPTLPTLSSLALPLSPIGQARRQAAESADLTSAVCTSPVDETRFFSPPSWISQEDMHGQYGPAAVG